MKNTNTASKSSKSAALIYQHDCHPVTKAFSSPITEDFYSIKKLPLHIMSGPLYSMYLAMKIPKHDIYITDSAMSNLVPIFKRWFGDKNIIIYRGADGIFGERSTAYLYTKNPIKKKVLLYILKQVDGITTESEMAKNDAKRWVKCPIEVNISYVNKIKELSDIRPKLDTKRFLFIGEYRPPFDHKGVEILIETFNLLPEKYELYIIGKNTELLKDRIKKSNIHIEGRVNDLMEYYKKCTYYIHPARYETGPITVLEAMSAGLIPIVSDRCGHKDIVMKVSDKMILTSSGPKTIAEQILKISKTDISQLHVWSKESKKLINFDYSKEKQTERFKKSFNKLVKEIERKRIKK